MKEPIRELRCHYLVTCVYNNTHLYLSKQLDKSILGIYKIHENIQDLQILADVLAPAATGER